MAYLEITDDLTKMAVNKLQIGQVLIFDFEGSPVHLKIMRKTKNRVWAKRLDSEKFLTPQEADERIVVTPKN